MGYKTESKKQKTTTRKRQTKIIDNSLVVTLSEGKLGDGEVEESKGGQIYGDGIRTDSG